MDALFIMKAVVFLALFIGGVVGCAFGTIVTKIFNKLDNGEW